MLLGISATIKNAHRYLMGILSETEISVSAEYIYLKPYYLKPRLSSMILGVIKINNSVLSSCFVLRLKA